MKFTSIIAAVASIQCFTYAIAIPDANASPAFEVTQVESSPDDNFSAEASTCTFQAFAGNACNGKAGPVVKLGKGGKCLKNTYGNHSFRISKGCKPQEIILFNYYSCSGSAVTRTYGASCYNVNTGTAWASTHVN